ncbi:retropepsin-like aspartic protease family protein [Filomicrobium insigne]|uniref:retropepsin-like aspartic protease family protein n=1 Tax=Filomicrobium insigne TaxID=418854 RepID=UPI000B7F5094|nr:TIGR02281 family clan AA aspartic protease [Filomicrobium insigne]
MALSTGTRALLSEALSWTAATAMIAVVAAHYTEIRDFALQTLSSSQNNVTQITDARSVPGSSPYGYVELRADTQGHYNSDIEINGRTVHAMVDTGATMVAMSYEDAEHAGIFLSPSNFTHRVNTANGVARVAPVTLDRVRLGSIEVRDVRAAVAERGRLNGTLLGMSFLGRISRLEMRDGVLVLQD